MLYPLGDGKGLEVRCISFANLSSSGPLYTGAGWLMGWIIAPDTPATAAVLELVDGNDANGDSFALLRIAADTTSTGSRSVPGLPLETGLAVKITSGSVSGSVVIGRPL